MGLLANTELKWKDLFPTSWSFLVFILYMALFINQGILVTASQNGQKGYSYNTVTAVLLTEIIKLIVSSGLFVHRKSLSVFVNEVSKNSKVFLLYFIPAFLYCLYNNLAYTNLATFDPTTYFLLLQFRVVVTGVVFQILFKKNLSTHQWISLLFLTVGCMVKEINFDAIFGSKTLGVSPTVESSSKSSALEFVGLLLIFLQVVCSSSAGVYNEYLLKGTGVPVLVQNTCLYLDSIICNIVLLFIQGNLSSGLNMESVQTILGTPINLACFGTNVHSGPLLDDFWYSHLFEYFTCYMHSHSGYLFVFLTTCCQPRKDRRISSKIISSRF
ncbi:unnamed protein product [Allacma fusca]|uniref:Uncharacterized protein n=1 Tax=Allacma fusca TaxID=39272 RepID=A0A8J2LFI3_9HEXA|nr:unnamed protein product [Allacma fusca]